MKKVVTRRDFLRVSGLTSLVASASVSGLSCPGFLAIDPNVETDVLQIPYADRKMGVGVWHNPNFSGERPLIVSSHGFSASSVDLGTLHNYLANKGYVILAPDHKDAYNFGGSDMLKDSSPAVQEVIDQFGSVDNYVRTVLFSPYLDLKKEGKAFININLDVLTNLFTKTFNQIRDIPDYSEYKIQDLYNLVEWLLSGDVDDQRVIDILGSALYESRVRDISNLVDFATGDNHMGNNPRHRNILEEKFSGDVQIDSSKLCGMGYSLGGGTMLEILGAGDPCKGSEYYDKRFEKSPVVLIAPAAALNHKENFPSINNNVLFFDGDNDILLKGIVRRQPLLPNGKEVIIYGDSGHITFSDTACGSDINYRLLSMIPQIVEEWGDCDTHEAVTPSRNKYVGRFFDRELGIKAEKQTELIDGALQNPDVRYATSYPIDVVEFQELFPEYAGQF